jgi:hypothetical protein
MTASLFSSQLKYSRYLGIPLLAAVSLAISLALLPMQPPGANNADSMTPAMILVSPA